MTMTSSQSAWIIMQQQISLDYQIKEMKGRKKMLEVVMEDSSIQELSAPLNEGDPAVRPLVDANSSSEGVLGKGRKKKFKTRIKEFNPPSSHSLVNSYDYSSLGLDSLDQHSAREKNNMAARISRKRKKMYIDLLESQNNTLELEIFQISEEIEILRTEIFNALMHTDEVNSKNAEIQSVVIKKLNALAHAKPSSHSDAEINICLDSCIYRIGASGSERMAILDILYKGFINRNLPNIYRFLLWASMHRKANFSEVEKQSGNWWEFIKSDFMKSFEELFREEKGTKIESKGREILRCAREILNIKKEIQQSGSLFDRFIRQIRDILTPSQSALLFLFAERATPKRELQLFDDPLPQRKQFQCDQLLNLCEERGRLGRKRIKGAQSCKAEE